MRYLVLKKSLNIYLRARNDELNPLEIFLNEYLVLKKSLDIYLIWLKVKILIL